LHVRDLTIDYWQGQRWVNVVNRVTFEVRPGETFGLVGESGCGKSTTAYSLIGYQRPGSRRRGGGVVFDGQDVFALPAGALQRLRGGQISLVPQNPTTALSPGMPVGEQLIETLAAHGVGAGRGERLARTHDLLAQVRLPDPERAARKYPHQLSGGQQQRVVIAMALICRPKVVVLDEPTTGLDVTTQAQILDLLVALSRELNTALVYVTHNMGVVVSVCDRVGVMYAGELVEQALTADIFRNPRHPYTRGLIASVPRLDAPMQGRSVLLSGILDREALPPGCRFAPRCEFAEDACRAQPQALIAVGEGHGASHAVACRRWQEVPRLIEARGAAAPLSPHVQAQQAEASTAQSPTALLDVDDLVCAYRGEGSAIFGGKAKIVVRGVSFDIAPGETFALVGESGSGKSTIARAVEGLIAPAGGTIRYAGEDIGRPVQRREQRLRREIQLILQNPDASLNPRQRLAQIVGRPLELFMGLRGAALRGRVERLLEDVRLNRTYADRFPDQLSGGERQRVAIARALGVDPALVLCDEILSALDVSVQADVLDLLRDLQAKRGMSYLFISHDLAVVRSLAHRVGVLYRGEMVEVGRVEEVYTPPFHPYTQMLLASAPDIPDPDADPEATGVTEVTEITEITEANRANVNARAALTPDQPGQPPGAVRPPRSGAALDSAPTQSACPFAHRCPWKVGAICDEAPPPWQATSQTHALRCHIPLAELQTRQSSHPRQDASRGSAAARISANVPHQA
jgi:peptide/nickel transport system ATP-binding protein